MPPDIDQNQLDRLWWRLNTWCQDTWSGSPRHVICPPAPGCSSPRSVCAPPRTPPRSSPRAWSCWRPPAAAGPRRGWRGPRRSGRPSPWRRCWAGSRPRTSWQLQSCCGDNTGSGREHAPTLNSPEKFIDVKKSVMKSSEEEWLKIKLPATQTRHRIKINSWKWMGLDVVFP